MNFTIKGYSSDGRAAVSKTACRRFEPFYHRHDKSPADAGEIFESKDIMRNKAVVACQPHKLDGAGSIPASARDIKCYRTPSRWYVLFLLTAELKLYIDILRLMENLDKINIPGF